jgi:hypothetical protein
LIPGFERKGRSALVMAGIAMRVEEPNNLAIEGNLRRDDIVAVCWDSGGQQDQPAFRGHSAVRHRKEIVSKWV